jgi:endoglucanase
VTGALRGLPAALLLAACASSAPPPTPRPTPLPTVPLAGRPVDRHGQLRVCGTKLCNASGSPVQLRGMSTHGLQWYEHCLTDASLDALAGDWRADLLRVSLYVQEGGYETDPAGFTARAERVADAAVARGLYVLLDWHILTPGDPMHNAARARDYFAHMATRYGATPNVMYEIANEPNGVSWGRIREYALQVMPVIRDRDPDGIVIVGTRGWSSLGVSEGGGAAEIVADPVPGNDIMYAFHFYAASHRDSYRGELSWAADRLPIFATEWGSQAFTGDGPNDLASAQAYIDLMAAKQISWTGWNYADDPRSGAAWKAGTCPGGPWTEDSLKEAGRFFREKVRSW